jgi:hypothetical protein
MSNAARRSLLRSSLERPVQLLICALLTALPAAGDPLSDLRAVLQLYPAKASFAASASLRVNGESEDVAASRGGSTNFEVEFGSAGMLLRVPPAALGAAESEAESKNRNPENLKPRLAGTRSRLVNEPKIELRIRVRADGIPVAAERDSNYSASFLFVKAANVRKERWEIAVAGNRLYASRADQNNEASAVGKNIAGSLSVACTPK